MKRTLALTRGVPSSFARATVQRAGDADDPAIDVQRARAQHAAYVEALRALGLEVVSLPADDAFPDCCFIEDCALVAGGVALITRSGAASRRGEVTEVARELSRHLGVGRVGRVVTMEAPATLDGGDCMRIGARIYVGRSARTNAEGVSRVRAVFAPLGFDVVEVPLADVLHLKCVCSPLPGERVLLADGALPRALFDGLEVVTIPESESYAANCLSHGEGAIIAEGFPHTRAALERLGLRVIALETSEMAKADGSLTCLSILFAP